MKDVVYTIQIVVYSSSSLIRLTMRSKRAFERGKSIQILSVKALSVNQTIHTYTVLVVLTHTVAERSEVTQIYPVCCVVIAFKIVFLSY